MGMGSNTLGQCLGIGHAANSRQRATQHKLQYDIQTTLADLFILYGVHDCLQLCYEQCITQH